MSLCSLKKKKKCKNGSRDAIQEILSYFTQQKIVVGLRAEEIKRQVEKQRIYFNSFGNRNSEHGF